MSEDERLDAVFREIEPPPGGLNRLRARILADAEHARGRRWVLVAVPALVVALCVVGVVLWRGGHPSPRPAQVVVVVERAPAATRVAHATALARLAAHADTPDAPVTVGVGARGRWVLEPVAESDAVLFYLAAELD